MSPSLLTVDMSRGLIQKLSVEFPANVSPLELTLPALLTTLSLQCLRQDYQPSREVSDSRFLSSSPFISPTVFPKSVRKISS